MDTRFLESFITVIERGSIADASRKLNLTPAAVAQRIRALEVDVGAELLSRSGRTVKPTSAGSAIADHARLLLRQVRDLRALASGDRMDGELRLGAISTAVTGMLPDVLNRLTTKFPRLEIYIVPGTSVELHQKAIDGDVDAAIIVEPPFSIPKAFEWHSLREEPLILLSHRPVPLGDIDHVLRAEPFIRYDRNHWDGRLTDSYLRHAGIQPRERFELDALDAIAVMVHKKLGVSLIPDWAPPWPQDLSVYKTRIPDTAYNRRIGLLAARNSARGHIARALLLEATA